MTITHFSATTSRTPFPHPFPRQAAAGSGARGDLTGSTGQPGERLLGRRVLIVEDEALLALELQYAFEDEGAEVIGPAMSLDKAMEAVATQEIDLAVLDVDIAGREVFPVAMLLQQRGVPFVFHTGHGSRIELEAMFPGAITCMKPTMPGALVLHLVGLTR